MIAVRGLPHALFFPGRVGRWSGSDWAVAVVSPSLRRQDLVPQAPRRQDLVPRLVGKIDKKLVEMGLGGSVWVDTEGIRSHGGYKGSDISDWDLGWDIILKYFLDVGLGKGRAKKSKTIRSPEVAYGYQKSELDLWEYF